MLVVFSLDDSDRDIWFVVKDVISSLAFTTGGEITFYIDSAIREPDFFTDLFAHVPAGLLQRRRDELGADVAL